MDDVTIAARVPTALKAELVELIGPRFTNPRTGEPDLSTVIVTACRRLLTSEAERVTLEQRNGTAHGNGRPTERAAATSPRRGSQRYDALRMFRIAGDHGLTTDEVLEALEDEARAEARPLPAANSVPRRVTDLLEAGAIEPVRVRLGSTGWRAYASTFDRAGLPGEGSDGAGNLTRKTRHGRDATVWAITTKGREWLA